MLIYDLALNAWVERPGSTSPPSMTPVLVNNGNFSFEVQFVRGQTPEDMGGLTDWTAAIKEQGDYSGTAIGSTTTPTETGAGIMSFLIDVQSTYFATHADEDTLLAVFAIGYTDADANERKLVPLPVVIQNDYLQA
jgi:hypothetical protein